MEGVCGLLRHQGCGTRRAAERWQDECSSTLVAANFIQGSASACVFAHKEGGIAVSVHGDDFTVLAHEGNLNCVRCAMPAGLEGVFVKR